jgi:hypothetical protein
MGGEIRIGTSRMGLHTLERAFLSGEDAGFKVA